MMANQPFTPFLYGATAHLPAQKRGKSEFVLIDIAQHPIIFSRAVCTLQPDDKLLENEVYLRECRRICEATCPIRESRQLNVLCKRLSLIQAIAETADQAELDTRKWAELLSHGLCKPVLF